MQLHKTSGSIDDNPCAWKSDCFECVADSRCGYCYDSRNEQNTASCDLTDPLQSQQPLSPFSRCANVSSNINENIHWSENFCPSKYGWLSLVAMCLYLVAFASGMGPMPWAINADLYPMWARSACTAIATSTNWFCNLVVSLTFLTLSEIATTQGAFAIYGTFALVGVTIFYFYLPETSQISLDIDEDDDQPQFMGH